MLFVFHLMLHVLHLLLFVLHLLLFVFHLMLHVLHLILSVLHLLLLAHLTQRVMWGIVITWRQSSSSSVNFCILILYSETTGPIETKLGMNAQCLNPKVQMYREFMLILTCINRTPVSQISWLWKCFLFLHFRNRWINCAFNERKTN